MLENAVQGRTDPNPDEADRIGPFSRTQAIHDAGPEYETCNMFYPRELLERGALLLDGIPSI
jgi:hypothetical protein